MAAMGIMKREPLENLSKDPFDVVVIGGGINGSGAAQELSARGYRTLVVDKNDFSLIKPPRGKPRDIILLTDK